MTDCELTIAAAKAMGLELDLTVRPDGEPFYHSDRHAVATADGGWFGPLGDDGDALRLAVKLKIGMRFTWDGCDDQYDAIWAEHGRVRCDEELGITPNGCQFDEMAATRRAIVRAAAEIGKAIP